MKLNLRFLRFPDNARNRELIRSELEPLGQQLKISAAHATVEQPAEKQQTVRAALHLEVPGPDITAAASDYTLAAAWRKVMKLVRRELQRRAGRASRSPSLNLRRHGVPARA